MEQYQSGDDQSLAGSVSMATEANEAAISANAALAQMRRNLREIGNLYPVIDDFHERIAIVNGRAEGTISQTERLLTERPGAKIGAASKRTEVFVESDRISAMPNEFYDWRAEQRVSNYISEYEKGNVKFEQSTDESEL